MSSGELRREIHEIKGMVEESGDHEAQAKDGAVDVVRRLGRIAQQFYELAGEAATLKVETVKVLYQTAEAYARVGNERLQGAVQGTNSPIAHEAIGMTSELAARLADQSRQMSAIVSIIQFGLPAMAREAGDQFQGVSDGLLALVDSAAPPSAAGVVEVLDQYGNVV